MIMKDVSKHRSGKKGGGYILLYSLLTISLLLSLAFGIHAISMKEITLSFLLSNSARAFAAADRGAECALYWDFGYPQSGITQSGTHRSVFASSSADVAGWSPPNGVVYCHNGTANVDIKNIPWTFTGTTATENTTSFSMNYSDGTCANISVRKYVNAGTPMTVIRSDGFNTCAASLPLRTQRTVEITTQYY